MEEHRTEAERRLQPLIDQGIVTKVTWAAGGYGTEPLEAVIRVLVAGDVTARLNADIEAKLSGIGAPFRIVPVRH